MFAKKRAHEAVEQAMQIVVTSKHNAKFYGTTATGHMKSHETGKRARPATPA